MYRGFKKNNNTILSNNNTILSKVIKRFCFFYKQHKKESQMKRTTNRKSRRFEAIKVDNIRKSPFNKWYSLMESCVDVFDESWARDFFDDVESLARELNLTLIDGRKFSADDALEDWRIVEDKVNEWIEEEDLDVDDGLPNVGLVYRTHNDRLVLGIHDGIGGFDEMASWEFTDSPNRMERLNVIR